MKKRNFFKPAHRDKAEPLIITAGRSVGATVVQLNGKDVPDLLVGFHGVTYLAEVKSRLENEKKDGYTRKTTTRVSKGQKEFAEKWRGGPTGIVYEPAELLMLIGAPRVKTTGPDGVRWHWMSESGAFLCESCWLPEDGLHAKDCPNRTRLRPKPAVQSAHRAANKVEEAMPKQYVRVYDRDLNLVQENELPAGTEKVVFSGPETVMTTEGLVYRDNHGVTIDLRPSRGVEGELQPLKVKR